MYDLIAKRVHLISNNERVHCMVLYTGIQQEMNSSQNTLKTCYETPLIYEYHTIKTKIKQPTK